MINPALLLARTKKEAITRNFSAGVEIDPIPLELPGYYCDILLKFLLKLNTGSTVSPVTDWDAKIFSHLWIKSSNERPYLDLSDARYLKYLNYLRAHGALHIPDLPDVNLEDQEVKWQYHIHPGDLFLDKKDITDVIARRGLNNLALRLTWGEDSDLGTGYEIQSGKVEVVTSYVVLQPGIRETQAFPGMALPGRVARPSFFQPQWRIDKFGPIEDTHENYGYVKNFMNGFLLREVLLIVLDATTLEPRDDLVTQIRIANKEGFDFWTKDLEELELENMQEFELSEPLTGIAWIDLKDIWQKTRAGVYFASAEDMKWNFTTECSSTDKAYIVLVYRTHWRTESRADVVGKTPAEFVV